MKLSGQGICAGSFMLIAFQVPLTLVFTSGEVRIARGNADYRTLLTDEL